MTVGHHWLGQLIGNGGVAGTVADHEDVDVNSQDNTGRIPIYWADGECEDRWVIEELLQRGAYDLQSLKDVMKDITFGIVNNHSIRYV
jgi:hypothetical protein